MLLFFLQKQPGGTNQLTDNSEFYVPTEEIFVAKRWKQNLGPLTQAWKTSPLRFIKNWVNGTKMGDFTAKNMTQGFFGTYSHDKDEGVVRVFDIEKTPGLDTWTYGFHPNHTVPMGSGKNSNGYAEMWGGNVRNFPDERASLDANSTVTWVEYVYPIHGTDGISCANHRFTSYAAMDVKKNRSNATFEINLNLCPTSIMSKGTIKIEIFQVDNSRNNQMKNMSNKNGDSQRIILASRVISHEISPENILSDEKFNNLRLVDREYKHSSRDILINIHLLQIGGDFEKVCEFEPNDEI